MIFVFNDLINNGLDDSTLILSPAEENGTIAISDCKNITIMLIKMVDLGTEFNLGINPNQNLIVTLNDLFFEPTKAQKNICDWINSFLKGVNYSKIARNQRIVDYLNGLFKVLDPTMYVNQISFRLNNIHPEILTDVGNDVATTIFGVRENGACFVLKDIDTNKTIIVNYTDYLIGQDVKEHLKKWLTNHILGEEKG